jgi:nucleotide-binding universal stress UspA family protein
VFKHIVVGTDGSPTALHAVTEAAELARATGARLNIVCAYEPVPESRLREEAREAPDDVRWMINPHEDADVALREAADRATEFGVTDIDQHARQGEPAGVLLDVAEEIGADLIVVGNKGMTGARRFLLGSVPNQVSHHAPCSVLIVRTT